MSTGEDIIPKSVNDFFNEVDTFLCLPLLLGMILCTLQFIFNHALSIGCTVYQNIQDIEGSIGKYAMNAESVAGIIEKLKEIFGRLPFGKIINTNSGGEDVPDPQTQEEDWDYCDEDVES